MLSAALIVRNEASEIEACLTSLREVDELVVVDTGSEDDTIARVAKWRVRHDKPGAIAHFKWCDDFAAARNHAASLCTGDWILHIDADMRVAAGGIPALRKALAKAKGRTMAITQQSLKGGWRNRRVLCHRPGVQWGGAIHESLEHDDGELAPVTVYYGWSDSHHKDPDRNLRILCAEADRDPTPRTCYYLGAELWDRGRIDEAADWFTQCAAKTAWAAERADALLYLAKVRWRQHRGDEARVLCLQSIGLAPDCKEAVLLMAEMSYPAEAAVWTRYATQAKNTGLLFARAA
jgi:glycosyltransferase involved in cell wall biosynthesis